MRFWCWSCSWIVPIIFWSVRKICSKMNRLWFACFGIRSFLLTCWFMYYIDVRGWRGRFMLWMICSRIFLLSKKTVAYIRWYWWGNKRWYYAIVFFSWIILPTGVSVLGTRRILSDRGKGSKRFLCCGKVASYWRRWWASVWVGIHFGERCWTWRVQ